MFKRSISPEFVQHSKVLKKNYNENVSVRCLESAAKNSVEELENSFIELIDSNGMSLAEVEAWCESTILRKNQIDRKLFIDQFLRSYLLKCDHDRKRWAQVLEFSIILATNEYCSALCPITLIADLMEMSDISDCEFLFDFFENRLDVWKQPYFMSSGKNSVLRTCNDLLKRLSRSQNTLFCGRILIFLAKYFPFSERSGLNIMSECNIGNTTSYKLGDGTDDPDDPIGSSSIDITDDNFFEGIDINIPGLEESISKEKEKKCQRIQVDYNLYTKFWSLQDFFRAPQQCYNKIAWKTFVSYTSDVLGAFHSFKLDKSQFKSKPGMKDDAEQNSAFSSGHFLKYLTNRRLLELQLSDSSFRTYFLVQMLILLQYLTAEVKFKSESQKLSEEQEDFVKKTTEKVYQLLNELNDGPRFVSSLKNVLKRENLWSKWKNDGCPPLKLSNSGNSSGKPKSTDSEHFKKNLTMLEEQNLEKNLGDLIKDTEDNGKIDMGNNELTRLWNICTDNLKACKSKSRDFLPQLDVYFSDAFQELDQAPIHPLSLQESDKNRIKAKHFLGDKNFGWRSLRLLARRSPYFFQMYGGSPIHPMEVYLEFILKKVQMDYDSSQATNKNAKPTVNNDQEPEESPTLNSASRKPLELEENMESIMEENGDEDEMLNNEEEAQSGPTEEI